MQPLWIWPKLPKVIYSQCNYTHSYTYFCSNSISGICVCTTISCAQLGWSGNLANIWFCQFETSSKSWLASRVETTSTLRKSNYCKAFALPGINHFAFIIFICDTDSKVQSAEKQQLLVSQTNTNNKSTNNNSNNSNKKKRK